MGTSDDAGRGDRYAPCGGARPERAPRARFRTGSTSRCPVAWYTGQKAWYGKKGNPVWANLFIDAFDADDRQTMSGAEALKILMRSGYRKA